MKNKNRKYKSSSNVTESKFTKDLSQNHNLERDIVLNSTESSVISFPMKGFTESLAVEEVSEKKEYKKKKKKRSEHMESNEKLSNNSNFGEGEASPCKKRKKVMDSLKYKPGMLSDLLQEKKYGCLILPWESTFGKDQPPSGLISDRDETEQKLRIKINPLFDMSKRNEGNIVPKRSTTYTVFVGNLPQEVTVSQVKKIFKKIANTISKIKIRSEEKKKSKMIAGSIQNDGINDQYKHAIVKFSSLDSYEAALRMNGKLYKGHHLRVTGAEDEASSDPDKSVFVGNLAVGTSDDELWSTFENCGEIDSVRVIRDKLNKKGNFGYVNFKSAESVSQALELDGTSILNREIRVSRIKRNIDSLSDSVTVKRNKKKRTKPKKIVSGNGVESSNPANTFEGKEKKPRKSPKNKTVEHSNQDLEPGILTKKKKKKKRPAEVNKTSETE